MQAQTESRPVFILGSGRSGTSILTAAIKQGGEIAGFNEGHFLPLLGHFMRETERYFRIKRNLLDDPRHMIAHVDSSSLETEIISLFKRQFEAIQEDERWLDKSPGAAMIRAVPFLKQAWPGADFIFAKRRGIENVQSRLKKFPHVDFENHCRQWADCMTAWLEVKDKVADRSIEVEQRDIARRAQDVAVRIGQLLEFGPGHIKRVADIFTNSRPQDTGGQENDKALDIRETGWTSQQIRIFQKHCGAVSERFGYSETSTYFL